MTTDETNEEVDFSRMMKVQDLIIAEVLKDKSAPDYAEWEALVREVLEYKEEA